MWRSRQNYHHSVSSGLDTAYREAPVENASLTDLRLIIFSDHHRGNGDRADDFRLCQKIYHAALGYYDSLEYRLFLLGDVEELWERLLVRVVNQYRDTLEQEREFFRHGQAVRFLGNHDESLDRPWNRNVIERYLNNAPLYQSLVLRIREEPETPLLGELFFVHGHQGIRYSWLDRFMVRRLWAPVQRLTGLKVGMPSSDHRIRLTHERAMYEWAAAHGDLLLICGHTHHPVFMSTAWEQSVRDELDRLRTEKAPQEEIAMKEAELRWIATDLDEIRSSLPQAARPCYFNSGCCSFNDGTITGIEISGGRIRLVRWSGTTGSPERQVLRDADLKTVFGKCATGRCGESGDR